MPKIVSLQDTGRMWKEFHILNIAFDNNDSGDVLAKSTSPSYKVGDEVQYTKNERGGIKIQRDQSNFSNSSTSNYTPKVKQDNSEQIARSVVFKGAIDLVVASGKTSNNGHPLFCGQVPPRSHGRTSARRILRHPLPRKFTILKSSPSSEGFFSFLCFYDTPLPHKERRCIWLSPKSP